jgi:hypothetical protein
MFPENQFDMNNYEIFMMEICYFNDDVFGKFWIYFNQFTSIQNQTEKSIKIPPTMSH